MASDAVLPDLSGTVERSLLAGLGRELAEPIELAPNPANDFAAWAGGRMADLAAMTTGSSAGTAQGPQYGIRTKSYSGLTSTSALAKFKRIRASEGR